MNVAKIKRGKYSKIHVEKKYYKPKQLIPQPIGFIPLSWGTTSICRMPILLHCTSEPFQEEQSTTHKINQELPNRDKNFHNLV